jgi:hypothetical protein
VAACVAAFNTRFLESYMTPGIATVRCVVELTALRSAHMRVLIQTSSDGCLARILLLLMNPHPAVIAVFVVNAARLWGLWGKVEN